MKKLLKSLVYVVVFALFLTMFNVLNVNAEELIDEISITGIKMPVIGQTAGENMASIKVADGANYTIDEFEWQISSDGMYYNSTALDYYEFEENLYFQYVIILKANDGYGFSVDDEGEYTGTISVSDLKHSFCQQDDPGELIILGKPVYTVGEDNATYEVTEGAGQTYVIGESTEARFTVDAHQKIFDGQIVYIDGVEFDWINYEYETENTTIILPKDYLDTLSEGTHTIKFEFLNDKEAETTFTVATKTEEDTYEVIEGAGQTYVVDSTSDATFRIDADYSLFENGGKVYVDDSLVDKANYTSSEGSTIITLLKSFVDTLSEGNHTLKVEFSDSKTATTTFTVTKSAEILPPHTGIDVPNTGDNIFVSFSVLLLSVLVLGGSIIFRKRIN